MTKHDLIAKDNITIRAAMRRISKSGHKCLVIVDEDRILKGTLSDGDIRNAILSGADMDSLIKNFYQNNPTVLIKDRYKNSEVKKLFH